MTAVIDPFVLEYAPGPLVDLHPSIETLRSAVRGVVDELGTIPDERLESQWMWEGNEVDVRYGFYRALEAIERATSRVARSMVGIPSSEARYTAGATTLARWDLDGLLVAMTDDVVDATCSRYATLTTAEMDVMGGWMGFPVTIGFRMWRWPSHIEEHTVQLEKTLDMLSRRQSEVARLNRLITRAYGRLEALVFGHSAAQLGAAPAALQILSELASELAGLGPSVRIAADAAIPASDA